MSADSLNLGRLDHVADVRDVWKHEASVFTPWLATNIDVLGDALGLELTVVDTEVSVGIFKLDIQAKDQYDRTIVIENQIEPGDHGHLGQLIAYLGGLDASIAVWIATRIKPDHRSALEWLNNNTPPGVGFFAIELHAVSIGDSLKAPMLDVVVRPNDWAKAAKQAGAGVSTMTQRRMIFFERFFDRLADVCPKIRRATVQPENWCSFAAGPFGSYSVTFSKSGFRVEVSLALGDEVSTSILFEELSGRKPEIENTLGFPLEWESLDGKKSSRLAVYTSDFNLHDDNSVASLVEWAVHRTARLYAKLDDELRNRAKTIKNSAVPPL